MYPGNPRNLDFLMRKGLKRNGCKSVSHQLFKDRAKNRVDDLQMIFSDLQSARKDSRTVDAAVLEEQVYLMLREWKSELNEPSPASSLQVRFLYLYLCFLSLVIYTMKKKRAYGHLRLNGFL